MNTNDVNVLVKLLDLIKSNNLNSNMDVEVDGIVERMKNLAAENAFLKQKVVELDSKIGWLERYALNFPVIAQIDIINEIADRQMRSQNVVMYHLPEEIYNPFETSVSDYDRVKSIFKVMELDIESFKFSRIGRPSERDRPIKIFFDDTVNMKDVIRAQTKLLLSSDFSGIRLVADRTQKQRMHMSLLKRELKCRQQNGEPNLAIKFIKGNPVII